MLSCPRCPVVQCDRHRGDDVCCSVVLRTLVGVMWSELLMKVCLSVVVNVMLTIMSVMSPHPALCNLLVGMVVKLCTLGVLDLGVSLVS